MRYEAHMTFALKDADVVEKVSQEYPFWKFSKIHGCPMMGPDAKYAYLTGYTSISGETLLVEMNRMALRLRLNSIQPLRLKIEHIIYDTKTGVNELHDKPVEVKYCNACSREAWPHMRCIC